MPPTDYPCCWKRPSCTGVYKVCEAHLFLHTESKNLTKRKKLGSRMSSHHRSQMSPMKTVDFEAESQKPITEIPVHQVNILNELKLRGAFSIHFLYDGLSCRPNSARL